MQQCTNFNQNPLRLSKYEHYFKFFVLEYAISSETQNTLHVQRVIVNFQERTRTNKRHSQRDFQGVH